MEVSDTIDRQIYTSTNFLYMFDICTYTYTLYIYTYIHSRPLIKDQHHIGVSWRYRILSLSLYTYTRIHIHIYICAIWHRHFVAILWLHKKQGAMVFVLTVLATSPQHCYVLVTPLRPWTDCCKGAGRNDRAIRHKQGPRQARATHRDGFRVYLTLRAVAPYVYVVCLLGPLKKLDT